MPFSFRVLLGAFRNTFFSFSLMTIDLQLEKPLVGGKKKRFLNWKYDHKWALDIYKFGFCSYELINWLGMEMVSQQIMLPGFISGLQR